jgi:hypothetical protein
LRIVEGYVFYPSTVAVVSFAADEAWDALFGVKTTEVGTAGAGAFCFLLCSHLVLENEEQLSVPRRRRHFSF